MCITGGGAIYQIYIDTYFVVNFWINTWVLFLCRFLVHSKVKIKRVLGIAFLGTVGECLLLIVPFPVGWMKSVVGFGVITLGMIAFLFRPKTREYFFRLLLTAYIVALLLGGSLQTLETIFRFSQISCVALVTVIPFLGMIIQWITLWIQEKKSKKYIPVQLFFSNGESCQTVGLVDTGNGLRDPISQKPVCIIEERVIEPFRETFTMNTFRYVPFRSIGESDGMLETYMIPKMKWQQNEEWVEVEHPLIGIAKEVISTNEKYQMILHPEILEIGRISK